MDTVDMGGRHRLAVLALVPLLVAATGCHEDGRPGPTGPTVPGGAPTPASMAALGDSITRGFAACEGWGDCPQASWSTGTAKNLRSHRQRLAAVSGRGLATHNLAVSGATVSDLDRQARQAVAAEVEYVTILIGANDACARTEAGMTPLPEFQAAFTRAVDTLVRGLPRARILVVSVPDLARLWQIGKDDPRVRATWQTLRICPSMLADPTSPGDEANARRSRVRDRVIGYNRAMAAACQRHATCRWDGNAVFDYDFSLTMVSPRDHWHPSLLGQSTLADVSWNAGYWA